jgi:hypothetical protein
MTGRGINDAPALLKWIRSRHPGVSLRTAAVSMVIEGERLDAS